MNPNLKTGDRLKVIFPAISKNDTIAVNQKFLAERAGISRCVIEKVIDVAAAEFDRIANGYMHDMPELWEGIGGAMIPDEKMGDYRALAAEHGIDPDGEYAIYQEPLIGFFRANCITKVVLLRAPGRPDQFINCEGYDYARYVGEAAAGDFPGCDCCGAPATNRIEDVKLGQRFACPAHYRVTSDAADRHQNEARNERIDQKGPDYVPAQDAVLLARRIKAALRKLAPGAKWSVKATGYHRVDAQLIQLPAGMAALAAPGEETWGDVSKGWVSLGEREWAIELGRLLEQANAVLDRFNASTTNTLLQDQDWQAYDLRVSPSYRVFQGQLVAA
jgi:hypothetical protein